MRHAWLRFAFDSGALVLCVAGCATSRLEPQPAAAVHEAGGGVATGQVYRQSLYRVQYSGPEESGRLRVAIKQESETELTIASADTLGRALWTLELRNGATLVLDHRQKEFCRSTEDVRLAEVTLSMFPVESIPRILRGRLPIDLADDEAVGDSVEDFESGRRWSIRRQDDGAIAAWTMWVGEQPMLWWTRQDKGGILSHRDGSQFRWRLVIEEEIEASLARLAPPPGFREIPCHDFHVSELREDQPPSGGDRPPQ